MVYIIDVLQLETWNLKEMYLCKAINDSSSKDEELIRFSLNLDHVLK